MVSTKTLTLFALSATAAVALPHRRHSNNVCAGPKTRTVTSINSRSDSPNADVITTGKKGLSYNDASLLGLFSSSGAGWAYNWGSAPGGTVPQGIEFVPMCWGRNEAPTCADKILAQNPTHMLSFNEPDQVGQAHMDVGEAVGLHINNVAKPLAGKVKIGSPAVTNGEKSKGMGLAYLQNFIDGCAGQCALDFLNIHWYWEGSDEKDFQNRFVSFVEEAIVMAKASTTSGQVWITEFGNKGTTEQNIQFMNRAVEYLDNNPNVGRYAYFMVGQADGMGMVNGQSLNALGQAYNA